MKKILSMLSLGLVISAVLMTPVKSNASSVSGNSVSGNAIAPAASAPVYVAPTEEEIYAQKVAEMEARQKKEVTLANGSKVKTEIAGVYEVTSLKGTAVTTSKADVLTAVGLTEEDIKNGTNASMYMGDTYNKTVKEELANAASTNGKTVVSMLVADMYTITKDGKITKLNSSEEPVSMVFGLPKNAVETSRAYSILCVTADGSIVEMKDTDADPSTISIDATVFGKYVIVY